MSGGLSLSFSEVRVPQRSESPSGAATWRIVPREEGDGGWRARAYPQHVCRPPAASEPREVGREYVLRWRTYFHFFFAASPQAETSGILVKTSGNRVRVRGVNFREARIPAATLPQECSGSTDRKIGRQRAGIGLPKGARGAESTPNQTKERPGRADPIRSGRRPPSLWKGSHTAEHSVQRAGIPSIYKSTLPQ